MREAKRLRQLKKARTELYALHAAVECQPHALARLLEEVYAIRGRERWRIMCVRHCLMKIDQSPIP